jgi:hypothetical protein
MSYGEIPITHYFKIKDSWSRGFSEKRGLLPRGDAKGDSAALASLRASGLCPSGAISQDKPQLILILRVLVGDLNPQSSLNLALPKCGMILFIHTIYKAIFVSFYG